jgi:hypothetical protein
MGEQAASRWKIHQQIHIAVGLSLIASHGPKHRQVAGSEALQHLMQLRAECLEFGESHGLGQG